MFRKAKYTPEEKIQACSDYLYGKRSALEICQSLGSGKEKPSGSFWKWIASYKVSGEAPFIKTKVNKTYSKEFKMSVVEKYIEGAGSLTELAAKYEIPSVSTLNQWVLLYNSDMELKDYDPKQEVYMASARRKTTTDESKEVDELEKLRRENKRLKRQLEERDMTVELLKKVKEFERRRF